MPEVPDYITHLKRVFITGFKSIKSASIDFERGINIIIGKNATGKSNFIQAISYPLTHRLREVRPSAWALEFVSKKGMAYRWEKLKTNIPLELINENVDRKGIHIHQKAYLNGDLIWDSEVQDEESEKKSTFRGRISFFSILRSNEIRTFRRNFIWYNIPSQLDGLESPISITIDNEGYYEEGINTISIIRNKFLALVPDSIITDDKELDEDKLKEFLNFDEDIKSKVKAVTPIEDFRLKPPIIYSNDEKTTLENIILEFKVNNEWMPWSWLSDGTKRLFYIVSEVSIMKRAIIFIEEPELGIHPHQFHELMSFLVEESRNNQIIISTHSPKTLDCLDKNQLSRIVISTFDKIKGTQFKHLSLKEQKKASKYMEEVGYLSDYWLYSDLEA